MTFEGWKKSLMNKTYSQIKNDLVGWSLLSFSDTLKYPFFFS